jgi:hypothetical protein
LIGVEHIIRNNLADGSPQVIAVANEFDMIVGSSFQPAGCQELFDGDHDWNGLLQAK